MCLFVFAAIDNTVLSIFVLVKIFIHAQVLKSVVGENKLTFCLVYTAKYLV